MCVLRHSRAALVLGLIAVALAAGCGGGESPGPRVVLRLEIADARGPGHAPGAERFIERLSQLSHGNVRVVFTMPKALPDPVGTRDYPERESVLIRHVARGAADLGFVGAQTLGALGIKAFDALDAPMLIDSYPAEAAVIRSGLPSKMLHAVTRLGVQGVAVFAGPLSSPAMLHRPLLDSYQYHGLTFRVLASPARDAAALALGGRPNHTVYPWLLVAIGMLHGPIDALESDLDSLFFDIPGAGFKGFPTLYVTDNVHLWPDMTALIANQRRLARLSPAQREWVRQAAADATADSIDGANFDAEVVPDLCAEGVRFAEASASDVAALRRSFGPAYAGLERDPVTKAYIERIQQLKANLQPPTSLPVPAACRSDHPAPVGSGPGVRSTIPDGIYRMRLTARDLRRADLGGLDLQRYAGTQTLTLKEGKWTLKRETTFGRSVLAGTYSGSPARTDWKVKTLDGKPQQGGGRFSANGAGGNLTMVPVEVQDDLQAIEFGAHPWERIG